MNDNQYIEAMAAVDTADELASLFADSSRSDDAQVAEAIADHACRFPELTLDEWGRIIEWLPDSSSLTLNILIEQVVESASGSTMGDETVIAELKTNHPAYETAIDRYHQSNKIIARFADAEHSVPELPCGWGELESDGRPRYELQRVIGSGAQGTVYAAVDRRVNRESTSPRVAIKIMSRHNWSSDEANNAYAIRHPNVARVIDRGVENGSDFIVSELVNGPQLDTWVRRNGRVGWKQACQIVASIADGVQAAHAIQIVHRDLKPSNIVMDLDDRPVVTDFGISCAIGDDRDGSTKGTPFFMSPEQRRRDEFATAPSTDIYALGGVLFWMLTGAYPNGKTPRECYENLDSDDTQRFDALDQRSIPTRVRRVCERALSSSVIDRQDSCATLASELRSLIQHERIGWLDRSIGTRIRLYARKNAVTSAVIAALLIGSLTMGWLWMGSKIDARTAIADARLAELELKLQTARNDHELELQAEQNSHELIMAQREARHNAIQEAQASSIRRSQELLAQGAWVMQTTTALVKNIDQYATDEHILMLYALSHQEILKGIGESVDPSAHAAIVDSVIRKRTDEEVSPIKLAILADLSADLWDAAGEPALSIERRELALSLLSSHLDPQTIDDDEWVARIKSDLLQ